VDISPRVKTRLVLVALALVVARPSLADGWDLGLGPAFVNVSSPQLSSNGTYLGFRLFGGYRWERLGFEVSVTSPGQKLDTLPTTTIDYPADRAEFSVVDVSLRFDFLSLQTHTWSPYVQIGYGLAFLDWQTYAYSLAGTAVTLGAGADVRLHAGLFLRVGFSWISAGTSDPYGDATYTLASTSLFVTLGWQFGLAPLPATGGAAVPAAP